MKRHIWVICVWSGGLMACSSEGSPDPEALSGTYVPSSAEHAPTDGEGGQGNDVPIRMGEAAIDYAERPQAERWCWFMDGEADESILYEIDMDSGEWGMRRALADRPMEENGNCFTLHENTLVWRHRGTLSALDLTTEELLEVGQPDDTYFQIASNGSELLADCEPGVFCTYPSVTALFGFAPSGAVPGSEFGGWVLAYAGDALYTTESVAEFMGVYERSTGLRRQTILLGDREAIATSAGLQPVNQGFTVVGQRLFIHDGGGEGYIGGDGFQGDERGTRLDTYDIETGQHLESLYLGRRTIDPTGDVNPRGLICGGSF